MRAITKYEKQIYEIVSCSTNHMTAEEVLLALQKVYPMVSRATVYNNLNKLCQAKLIRKLTFENSIDRYDKAVRHDHLMCPKCGKVMDVNFEDLTASLNAQLNDDFLYYDLKVYRLCPDCKAAKNGQ